MSNSRCFTPHTSAPTSCDHGGSCVLSSLSSTCGRSLVEPAASASNADYYIEAHVRLPVNSVD